MACALCSAEQLGADAGEFDYPGQLCFRCHDRAVGASGKRPQHDGIADDGENPVYVDGMKCWRRYRLGGYVTMKDDSGCRTLEEFHGITADREWSGRLIAAASVALSERGKAIPAGLGGGEAGGRYRGATFQHEGVPWAVCRTALISSNAQLLDTAVAFKESSRTERVLAMLDPPEGKRGPNGASAEYLERYQRAAWHGLGVAFLPSDVAEGGFVVDPVRPAMLSGWLDDVVAEVRGALAASAVDAEMLGGSRDAEAVVRLVLGPILEGRGFTIAPSRSYKSFWRTPQADGVWLRDGDAAPRRVHLEVKLAEDDQAPFCQVLEGLGIADAVIHVRFVKQSVRERLNKLSAAHPWLVPARVRAQERLPVRFIEVVSKFDVRSSPHPLE